MIALVPTPHPDSSTILARLAIFCGVLPSPTRRSSVVRIGMPRCPSCPAHTLICGMRESYEWVKTLVYMNWQGCRGGARPGASSACRARRTDTIAAPLHGRSFHAPHPFERLATVEQRRIDREGERDAGTAFGSSHIGPHRCRIWSLCDHAAGGSRRGCSEDRADRWRHHTPQPRANWKEWRVLRPVHFFQS